MVYIIWTAYTKFLEFYKHERGSLSIISTSYFVFSYQEGIFGTNGGAKTPVKIWLNCHLAPQKIQILYKYKPLKKSPDSGYG